MNSADVSVSIVDRLVSECKNREAFWQIVGSLDPHTRVTIHDQLWDALMDIARKHNRALSREDITSQIQPSTDYQRRMGCTEPIYVCRRKTCINSNPSCVAQKISEHIEIIRQQLAAQ